MKQIQIAVTLLAIAAGYALASAGSGREWNYQVACAAHSVRPACIIIDTRNSEIVKVFWMPRPE